MSTKKMVLVALFAAVLAVLAQVSIPTPWGIPITGQLLGVFLAGAVLGGRLGFLTMVVYLFLGAFGLPVFAQAKGGLPVILGPTGGYLLGFALGVFILGRIVEASSKAGTARLAAGMLICLLVAYGLGTLQFALVTGRTFGEAVMLAVIPYLPFDLVKVAIAVPLGKVLRRSVQKAGMLP